MEGAKQVAQDLHDEAIDCLTDFSADANMLRLLANYIVQREK